MMAKWPLAKCPLVKCPLAKCLLAKCPGFADNTSDNFEQSDNLSVQPLYRKPQCRPVDIQFMSILESQLLMALNP